MNDRKDRPENSGRPRRASGGRPGGGDDRKPYRGGRSSDGERKPYQRDRSENGDRKPYRQDGERRPYRGDRAQDGERKPYRGDRQSSGERRPYNGDRSNDGERRPYRGDRSNDSGERRPYRGDRPESGDRKPYRGDRPQNGERRPYRGDRDERGRDGQSRDGQSRDRDTQGRERRPYRDAPRDQQGRGGTRGGGRSDRGGQAREYTEEERLRHSLRPVRSEHDDPVIADRVDARDLHPSARNELKTLQAEVQERVAKHLAMVALLIDEDPELAHQHAISASRRAGRIPVVRETLAMTAYRTGDYALAIRELRTFRRLSGRDTHLAIMVDSERGLGRPERAIETGLEVDRSTLDTEGRVHLAIAMSGARLDLGQTQQALFELEIPELDPEKAFSWSPELFGAYATVLEDLGRDAEAAEWFDRADRAEAALEEAFGVDDELEVIEIHEHEGLDEEDSGEPTGGDADTDADTE